MLGITHGDLALGTTELTRGRIRFDQIVTEFDIQMTTIGELFHLGPTHHLIGHIHGHASIGAFEFHPVRNSLDTVGGDRALWAADAKTQTRLVVLPTHKGVVPTGVGSQEARENIRKSVGSLHYARNIRWTSQAILGATTERPVLGGSTWTTLQHEDQRVCRIFALWANSTLGMITHWARSQRTQLGRSRVQIGGISQIPCPKFDDLEDATLDRAVTVFESLIPFDLLPACQAHVDDARILIDKHLVDLLQLPIEVEGIIAELRRLWCHEPSIHGYNRSALKFLQ